MSVAARWTILGHWAVFEQGDGTRRVACYFTPRVATFRHRPLQWIR
ncbi:MAG TPA: hypothetical protein VGX78_20285 [Pirellulales bacterium]|nr:hypothetical protein [Pirellulales bacterium]